ncbi:CRISPR-associated endonuclease/helicase Cas3 [Tulasnella sp. 419]|nr:CRISPR-associated endonuclease/helicase Cas3 [Tulasnella sp. 419]
MALSFEKIATGGDIHLGLSGYYDIPTISLKNVIASHVLAHPELEREFFASTPDGVDLRHLNVNGHTMLADLVVAYFRRQICDEVRYQFMYEYTDPTGSMARLLPKYSTMEDLPRLRLYAHYNQTETTPDINPTCMSMNSKNKLKPVENKGWVEWSWKDKPYLVGKKPGDKITFEVQIHSLGAVIMSYLQSKTLGLGRLKCWLNDNVAGARYISGYWNVDGVNLLKGDQIIINAPPGKHLVHCEITQETDDPKGGTEFRIVAVTST